MPGIKWTEDELRRAKAMRLAGCDIRDISDVLRRSAVSVAEMLYRHGIKLTEEQKAEIMKRNRGLVTPSHRVPAPRIDDADRAATIRFEEAYCAAAERNGWAIRAYAA